MRNIWVYLVGFLEKKKMMKRKLPDYKVTLLLKIMHLISFRSISMKSEVRSIP